MEKWSLYALDLYAFYIATADLHVYEITDGIKITKFTPVAQKDTGIEILVPGLLFKREDIIDVENRYELNPLNMDDGKATNANTKNDGKKNFSRNRKDDQQCLPGS